MLRALSVAFAALAVASMIAAVAGMVTGGRSPGSGWALRAGALLCFGIAVALNVAAH